MRARRGSQHHAAAALGRWFAARGQGQGQRLRWPAHPIGDAWLFTVPEMQYANRLWLVRGDDVVEFAPSLTTVDEAVMMLDDPARRRDDGLIAPYLRPGSTYVWAAKGPVMAAPIIRNRLTAAVLFHGTGDEQDAAGVLLRPLMDAAGVGRVWSAELGRLHQDGVPAIDAVHSLLGRHAPQGSGDGDVHPELGFSNVTKQTLLHLLEAQLPHRGPIPLRGRTSSSG